MSATSPFENKSFLQLFVAQIIALVGTGLSTIALALLAYDFALNEAGRVLGIALAIKMIAYVVLFIYVSYGSRLRVHHPPFLLSFLRARADCCFVWFVVLYYS